MKKRVGAPRRCSSWRMIFSAAASKVNFNIFGFMPGTSIRKFAPSRVKELVLNNRAAESRPAAANAAPMAWRMDSMLGAPEAGGAELGFVGLRKAEGAGCDSNGLVGASSVMGAVNAWPLVGGNVTGTGRSSSAIGVVVTDCFAACVVPQPPAPGPKGEMGDAAGGVMGVGAGRIGATVWLVLAEGRDGAGIDGAGNLLIDAPVGSGGTTSLFIFPPGASKPSKVIANLPSLYQISFSAGGQSFFAGPAAGKSFAHYAYPSGKLIYKLREADAFSGFAGIAASPAVKAGVWGISK